MEWEGQWVSYKGGGELLGFVVRESSKTVRVYAPSTDTISIEYKLELYVVPEYPITLTQYSQLIDLALDLKDEEMFNYYCGRRDVLLQNNSYHIPQNLLAQYGIKEPKKGWG